jgi:hypothetical protein
MVPIRTEESPSDSTPPKLPPLPHPRLDATGEGTTTAMVCGGWPAKSDGAGNNDRHGKDVNRDAPGDKDSVDADKGRKSADDEVEATGDESPSSEDGQGSDDGWGQPASASDDRFTCEVSTALEHPLDGSHPLPGRGHLPLEGRRQDGRLLRLLRLPGWAVPRGPMTVQVGVLSWMGILAVQAEPAPGRRCRRAAEGGARGHAVSTPLGPPAAADSRSSERSSTRTALENTPTLATP